MNIAHIVDDLMSFSLFLQIFWSKQIHRVNKRLLQWSFIIIYNYILYYTNFIFLCKTRVKFTIYIIVYELVKRKKKLCNFIFSWKQRRFPSAEELRRINGDIERVRSCGPKVIGLDWRPDFVMENPIWASTRRLQNESTSSRQQNRWIRRSHLKRRILHFTCSHLTKAANNSVMGAWNSRPSFSRL